MLFIYYRGGKICLTDHFKPLWARNVPKFGIAHCMALGVWLYLNTYFYVYQNYNILRMRMLGIYVLTIYVRSLQINLSVKLSKTQGIDLMIH